MEFCLCTLVLPENKFEAGYLFFRVVNVLLLACPVIWTSISNVNHVLSMPTSNCFKRHLKELCTKKWYWDFSPWYMGDFDFDFDFLWLTCIDLFWIFAFLGLWGSTHNLVLNPTLVKIKVGWITRITETQCRNLNRMAYVPQVIQVI